MYPELALGPRQAAGQVFCFWRDRGFVDYRRMHAGFVPVGDAQTVVPWHLVVGSLLDDPTATPVVKVATVSLPVVVAALSTAVHLRQNWLMLVAFQREVRSDFRA